LLGAGFEGGVAYSGACVGGGVVCVWGCVATVAGCVWVCVGAGCFLRGCCFCVIVCWTVSVLTIVLLPPHEARAAATAAVTGMRNGFFLSTTEAAKKAGAPSVQRPSIGTVSYLSIAGLVTGLPPSNESWIVRL
jgi:hypothetical protein